MDTRGQGSVGNRRLRRRIKRKSEPLLRLRSQEKNIFPLTRKINGLKNVDPCCTVPEWTRRFLLAHCTGLVISDWLPGVRADAKSLETTIGTQHLFGFRQHSALGIPGFAGGCA